MTQHSEHWTTPLAFKECYVQQATVIIFNHDVLCAMKTGVVFIKTWALPQDLTHGKHTTSTTWCWITMQNMSMHQQMHIYKYVQSHIAILHQHVSITPTTITRMSFNKHAFSIQITVQKCIIKPLNLTFDTLK
jgi:hypothetical protein